MSLFIFYFLFSIWHVESTTYESELLILINNYRTQNGLVPLKADERLKEIAFTHSTYMTQKNILSHANFQKRFTDSKSDLCVENIGWNASSPKVLFELWVKSESHNKNMLNPSIQRAGISLVGKYATFFGCK